MSKGIKRTEKLIFSVTNDLSYDQRMIRICSSLANEGYHVTLVGRKMPGSVPLQSHPYHQFRINCFFPKGFLFYAEFNIRLFFYLILKKATLVSAVDLDTILPTYFVSVIKNIPRVYDAHELFCEMKEVASRPRVHRFWKQIEKMMVPRFTYGYSVSELVTEELRKLYNVRYETVRNVPLPETDIAECKEDRYIIYQGAVNEGRCFENLLPAMKTVDARLIVCGNGNFMDRAKEIASHYGLNEKVEFKGWLSPGQLKQYTLNACAGVNILEDAGLNSRYSLANRFFDYIQAALPQLCVNFPAYREINDLYNCALMIDDTNIESISEGLNIVLNDRSLRNKLRSNCIEARKVLNWNQEEKILLKFYHKIFNHG